MKIKTGDNVKVISGADKGKTGKVIQVLRRKEDDKVFVVVEGVRMMKRHVRARRAGEKGQVIELSGPIHASKVMLIDPKSNKPTRVGYKQEGDLKKRVAKASGELID